MTVTRAAKAFFGLTVLFVLVVFAFLLWAVAGR
jgi:hypothetical protein